MIKMKCKCKEEMLFVGIEEGRIYPLGNLGDLFK